MRRLAVAPRPLAHPREGGVLGDGRRTAAGRVRGTDAGVRGIAGAWCQRLCHALNSGGSAPGIRAEDRGIYARSAVKAALWARGKPPGLYSMADVLGLKSF